jgi:hypothetical protein
MCGMMQQNFCRSAIECHIIARDERGEIACSSTASGAAMPTSAAMKREWEMPMQAVLDPPRKDDDD